MGFENAKSNSNFSKYFISYLEIPGQFNCVDKSGHILAAAYSSKIVFWDLRTGKQRTEFTSSFYG
jgi:hypothetical protein